MEMKTINFTIRIEGDTELDDNEKYEVTQMLKNELSDLEVEASDSNQDDNNAITGAKGDPITIGTIVLAAAAATIPNIILFIQNWLLRQRDHKIRVKLGGVEIEIPRDASREEISRIVTIVKNIPQK